jgi:hypothetical protein
MVMMMMIIIIIGKLPFCRKILWMVLKPRKNLRKKKQEGNVMCMSGEFFWVVACMVMVVRYVDTYHTK